MEINTDLYRVFLVAAESGTVSEAARRLFVTQPAVSSSIMQLENHLGVRLFLRESRGISLTAEGEILYENVKNAFIFLRTGEEKIRDMLELRGGILRVGASDMTLRFYLLDYMESWVTRYPALRLSVTNAPTPQTIKAIRSGQIDFGVISEPAAIDEHDITCVKVKQIRDIIVASKKYSANYSKKTHTMAEISRGTLIMLERGTSTRRYIESVFPDLREPDIELATSDLILDFAKRGMGAAFIVEDFAREAIAAGELYEIHPEKPIPPRSFVLAFSSKHSMCSAGKRFIEELGFSDYIR